MRALKRIEGLMNGVAGSTDARSELVQLATRWLREEAGEAEARNAAGREYYWPSGRRGHRDGYRRA